MPEELIEERLRRMIRQRQDDIAVLRREIASFEFALSGGNRGAEENLRSVAEEGNGRPKRKYVRTQKNQAAIKALRMMSPWTQEEDDKLLEALKKKPNLTPPDLARSLEDQVVGRTYGAIRQRLDRLSKRYSPEKPATMQRMTKQAAAKMASIPNWTDSDDAVILATVQERPNLPMNRIAMSIKDRDALPNRTYGAIVQRAKILKRQGKLTKRSRAAA